MAKRRKGEEPEVERDDEAVQLAEEAAMLGKMTPLERARFAFGLEEAHVLKAREATAPDGSVEVVLLTQGGQKLRWPQDEGRVLAQHEKDGTVPGAPRAGIFPAR
jgi:hypothetical protein